MIVNEEAVKKILEEVKPAKLVAATKYVDVHEIEKLEELGVTCFGENRVQAFLEKYEKYQRSVCCLRLSPPSVTCAVGMNAGMTWS